MFYSPVPQESVSMRDCPPVGNIKLEENEFLVLPQLMGMQSCQFQWQVLPLKVGRC